MVAHQLAGPLSTPTSIESSLLGTWEQWHSSPDWYESVIEHSTRLVRAIDLTWRESQAIEQWHDETRAGRRTFSHLRQRLLSLDLESILGLLQRRLATEEGASERDRFGTGLRSCAWLLEQAKSPRFATSLNIAGPFGSGRSRLLVDVAQRALAEGSLALLLTPKAGESVGGAIQRFVAEGAGIGISRFDELTKFLDGQPTQTKIHILLDDAHDWSKSGADDLQALIEASTESERVRWVIAADSSGLDSLSGRDPFFWVRHGHVPETSPGFPQPALNRTTGWLDLEAANREQLIGFEILRSHSTGDDAEIETLVADPDAFDHEFTHLANPLGAWIRLHEHERAVSNGEAGQPLLDVNSIPFVRSYWTWVKRLVSNNDVTRQAALERAMRALADSQVDQPGDHVVIEAVVAAQHEAALADLTSGGIVRSSWVGDPELGDQALRIDPTFPALFGLRVARLVLAHDKHGADEAAPLSPWWPLAEQGLGVAESTCQFALTLNSPAEDGAPPALWKAWAAQQASPKSPMLMAALTCGAEAEGVAVDCVARARYRPTKKRELFVLTRFAAKARLTEWSADARIQALKPHADSIRRSGLEPYLHLALTSILESEQLVNEANYLKVCHSLDDFPGEQIRELAANLLVQAGARIYADDDTAWIHTILRYCKKQPPGGTEKHGRGRARHSTNRGARRVPRQAEAAPFDAKHSFAAALTTAVSKHFVVTRGTDGLRLLAKVGWWTAADNYVHPALADHMRQKLTTEYGSTVHNHRGRSDRLDEYELVIRDLLNGSLLGGHREAGRIAYYLLKHSVPTYGRADVEIPAQLRPLLRTIQRDSRLTGRLAPEVHTLLRANGLGRSS